MSLDSLLAIAGLLIAVYAILPRSRRLELRLRVTWMDWIVLVIALLSVHYLQFYSFFVSIGWHPQLGLAQSGLTPNNVSYLILFGAAVIIGMHQWKASLRPRSVSRLRDLVEELVYTEKYTELVLILERHFKRLVRIYQGDFPLARLRHRLPGRPLTFDEMAGLVEQLTDGGIAEKNVPKSGRCMSWLGRCAAGFLPAYDKEKHIAQETLDRVLLSKGFLKALVETRPYFFIEVLNERLYFRREITELYLREMLADPTSALYMEIRNSRASVDPRQYELPESNRLLYYLFHDTRIAEDLQTWRGIGEGMIAELDYFARHPSEDFYNLAPDRFFEEEDRWKSSLFAGLSFFDIMVTSALIQGTQWHMGLHYISSIVERVIKNYSPNDPLVDPTAEIPTRYAEFLSEAIYRLVDWIKSVGDLPLDQKNVRLDNENLSYDNSSIPKSSILALGTCLRHILEAEVASRQFKQAVASPVFGLYFELRSHYKSGDMHPYARVLLRSVLEGGFPWDATTQSIVRVCLMPLKFMTR